MSGDTALRIWAQRARRRAHIWKWIPLVTLLLGAQIAFLVLVFHLTFRSVLRKKAKVGYSYNGTGSLAAFFFAGMSADWIFVDQIGNARQLDQYELIARSERK